jgi:cytochrome d ubiquinol oxidase subunit II
VRQAAAPHDTQVAVLVAILGGGALLLPALVTLFRLTLGGRLGEGEEPAHPEPSPVPPSSALQANVPAPQRPSLLVRATGALFVAGFGFTNVANAQWAHLVGAGCYLAFLVIGFRAALALPGALPAGD